MYKAYKFRLYPNKNQRILLNKNFGCQRFVYNHYLNNITENGYKNAYSNIKDYVSNLKNKNPFLQEVESASVRKILFHLDDNFKRHYNNNFGYPKYKSKYAKNSYMTSAVYRKYKNKEYCNIEINLKNRTIKLPKLKKVKIKGYRNLERINGRIINATLSEILRQLNYKAKEKGKYFYQVETYYPSSQLCSVCNTKDIKYKDLKERIYNCKNCHSKLDRDLNASINIMFEGLKMYMNEEYS